MVVGVGGILELGGHEGGGICGLKVAGAFDCALHALGFRSASDLGAEGPHDQYFFFRKFFRDEHADFVSAIDAD